MGCHLKQTIAYPLQIKGLAIKHIIDISCERLSYFLVSFLKLIPYKFHVNLLWNNIQLPQCTAAIKRAGDGLKNICSIM